MLSDFRNPAKLTDDVFDDAAKLFEEGQDLVASGFDISRMEPSPQDIVCLYHRSAPWPPPIRHDDHFLAVVVDLGAPFLELRFRPIVGAGHVVGEVEDGGAEDGD